MKPTETEIACFESGVKLGSLYHQFSGVPISLDNIKNLSSAIEKSIENQPYCTNVSVEISEEEVKKSMNEDFEYATINYKIHVMEAIKLSKENGIEKFILLSLPSRHN